MRKMSQENASHEPLCVTQISSSCHRLASSEAETSVNVIRDDMGCSFSLPLALCPQHVLCFVDLVKRSHEEATQYGISFFFKTFDR